MKAVKTITPWADDWTNAKSIAILWRRRTGNGSTWSVHAWCWGWNARKGMMFLPHVSTCFYMFLCLAIARYEHKLRFPKVGVPPKSSILKGFSVVNHPFGGPNLGHQNLLDMFLLLLRNYKFWITCFYPLASGMLGLAALWLVHHFR